MNSSKRQELIFTQSNSQANKNIASNLLEDYLGFVECVRRGIREPVKCIKIPLEFNNSMFYRLLQAVINSPLKETVEEFYSYDCSYVTFAPRLVDFPNLNKISMFFAGLTRASIIVLNAENKLLSEKVKISCDRNDTDQKTIDDGILSYDIVKEHFDNILTRHSNSEVEVYTKIKIARESMDHFMRVFSSISLGEKAARNFAILNDYNNTVLAPKLQSLDFAIASNALKEMGNIIKLRNG